MIHHSTLREVQDTGFFSGYAILIISLFVLLASCGSRQEQIMGTWVIPGHTHYFELREDNGYQIQGVDGYRQTGEWEVIDDVVLFRHRQGTDTLWLVEKSNSFVLEDRKNDKALLLATARSAYQDFDGVALSEFLFSDTLELVSESGQGTPVLFHEDAFLDLETGSEKLWHLKLFRNEWFLATEASTIMEYSRILKFDSNEIELEFLDRRSFSLRKTYIRRRKLQ